jgi:deazaflavin-dependent oxidoreductase (nitroreductase family)
MATTKQITYFSVFAYALTGGRADRGANAPAGFLKLTTTGRKSGLQRVHSLIYLRDGLDYALIASNGGKERDPGWLFNIRANPQVSLEVHGARINGVAEVAGPEKRRELWARLVAIAPMYLGYEKRTQREIPIVIVHPTA